MRGRSPKGGAETERQEGMSEPLRRGCLMAAAISIAVVLVAVGRYLGWLHVPLVVE
jgi:hypothetical protein